MPVKPKKPTEAPPDVERHDEVYFRHPSGPKSGSVLSRGAHGVTVEADGERHKVKWEDLHGHKVRVRPDVRVIDQGEDGMLVEDAAGRRRYVTDPLGITGDGEPAPVRKSLMPAVLFFAPRETLVKAIKNKAGLSLQGVTDKGGHQTKRWKKTAPDEHKDRPAGTPDQAAPLKRPAGSRVKFKAGDFEGEGELVGKPGEHGAHVRDSSGREHRVHWSEMSTGGSTSASSSKTGDGETDQKPHETGREGASAAGGLFGEETTSLPEKAQQPFNSWEEISQHADEALDQFKSALGEVAEKLDLPVGGDRSKPGVLIGRLKDRARAEDKVAKDYKGDWSSLRDVVRGTISAADMGGVATAIKAVQAAGLKLVQKPRDRFQKPTLEGYRDVLTIVQLPNGMLAELQFHLASITGAKKEGHTHYNVTRALQGKYGDEEPTDEWSADDHAAFYDALKAQRDLYEAAWKAAQGS